MGENIMRTNRPNWDHDKRVAVTPQLVKLCDRCGGYMANRYEVYHCTACRSTTFEVKYETEAAEYRIDLMHKRDEASRLALELIDQISRYFSEDMLTAWLNAAPADPFDFLEYVQREAAYVVATCFEAEKQETDEWLQPDEIVARLDSFSVRGDGAWIPNASEDDGADDRPLTG